MKALKPTFFIIMDGWGLAPASAGNAISQANTPVFDALMQGPHSRLRCSGPDVGLPPGFMGNSEVGHLNLGAGRVVNQEIRRIDLSIEDGSFAHNPVLHDLLQRARTSGGRLHCMGLLSDSGVHSHINHLFAVLACARAAGVDCVVHAFMDGRDAPPTSGIGFMQKLMSEAQRLGHCRIGSMVGRYYAMDRDKHWERTQVAWNALVHGEGERVDDPVVALQHAYAMGETDEFLKPRLFCSSEDAAPVIQDGDALFFFNYRADRARQLTRCFAQPHFNEFVCGPRPLLSAFATMTAYEADLAVPTIMPTEAVPHVLGEVVADLGLQQLRIAETEKYAHVTYFFNGGVEKQFTGEDRFLVPSPRGVPTYDLAPQMSAEAVAEGFITSWMKHRYSLVVCNFANADMVGHTGVIPAAIRACETVDRCVGRLLQLAKEYDCRVFLTADHGNAECMLAPDQTPFTSHTLNPVPLFYLDGGSQKPILPEGRLADIAPTILQLWGVSVPPAMNGCNLVMETR